MANTMSYAITTKDNPYDPFTDFRSWYLYDIEKGYNTCELLDQVAVTSELLSEAEYNEEISRAIDEIIQDDFADKYVKVERDLSTDKGEE